MAFRLTLEKRPASESFKAFEIVHVILDARQKPNSSYSSGVVFKLIKCQLGFSRTHVFGDVFALWRSINSFLATVSHEPKCESHFRVLYAVYDFVTTALSPIQFAW